MMLRETNGTETNGTMELGALAAWTQSLHVMDSHPLQLGNSSLTAIGYNVVPLHTILARNITLETHRTLRRLTERISSKFREWAAQQDQEVWRKEEANSLWTSLEDTDV